MRFINFYLSKRKDYCVFAVCFFKNARFSPLIDCKFCVFALQQPDTHKNMRSTPSLKQKRKILLRQRNLTDRELPQVIVEQWAIQSKEIQFSHYQEND